MLTGFGTRRLAAQLNVRTVKQTETMADFCIKFFMVVTFILASSCTTSPQTPAVRAKERCEVESLLPLPEGELQAPKVLARAEPNYPEALREGGIEGNVVIEGCISRDGRPTKLRVISSDHPDFTKAALEALEKWHFAPATIHGSPVEIKLGHTFNFKLPD